MHHLKLIVAYDGTNYVGWQVQHNGVSIQQRLEEAWLAVTGEKIRITASGRTDSGVHALGQSCSLTTESPLDCHSIRRALNAHTPDEISVMNVQRAPVGFHAIRDASRKTYLYQVQFGRIRNPIGKAYRWFIPCTLDVDAIQQAATYLVGEHDFSSFQAVGSERETTIRFFSKLNSAVHVEHGFHHLKIEMTSNGFLYNMARNIVGTLIKVGQGSQPPEWVDWVLGQKDRSVAGPTAPAHGLTLINVEYDGIEFSAGND